MAADKTHTIQITADQMTDHILGHGIDLAAIMQDPELKQTINDYLAGMPVELNQSQFDKLELSRSTDDLIKTFQQELPGRINEGTLTSSQYEALLISGETTVNPMQITAEHENNAIGHLHSEDYYRILIDVHGGSENQVKLNIEEVKALGLVTPALTEYAEKLSFIDENYKKDNIDSLSQQYPGAHTTFYSQELSEWKPSTKEEATPVTEDVKILPPEPSAELPLDIQIESEIEIVTSIGEMTRLTDEEVTEWREINETMLALEDAVDQEIMSIEEYEQLAETAAFIGSAEHLEALDRVNLVHEYAGLEEAADAEIINIQDQAEYEMLKEALEYNDSLDNTPESPAEVEQEITAGPDIDLTVSDIEELYGLSSGELDAIDYEYS